MKARGHVRSPRVSAILGPQSAWRRRERRCGCAGVCAESVTVSGVDAVQPARMDTYAKMPNVTHAGRPVYQLVGSTVAYLFYSASTGDWCIDSDYLLSDSSSVRSTGSAGAACPDQATGWQAYTGGAWVGTYPITVVPTRPPTLPATAPPATVGKRSRCVRSRQGVLLELARKRYRCGPTEFVCLFACSLGPAALPRGTSRPCQAAHPSKWYVHPRLLSAFAR
jgi:hypothetical protein